MWTGFGVMYYNFIQFHRIKCWQFTEFQLFVFCMLKVPIVIKSAEALRTNPDIFLISTSKERARCSKSAADLLPCGYRVDIRMRSNRLLSPDDNKSAPSCRCQQACCKLLSRLFYLKAWCKLFQKRAASLQISSCIKSDLHRLNEANRSDANW